MSLKLITARERNNRRGFFPSNSQFSSFSDASDNPDVLFGQEIQRYQQQLLRERASQSSLANCVIPRRIRGGSTSTPTSIDIKKNPVGITQESRNLAGDVRSGKQQSGSGGTIENLSGDATHNLDTSHRNGPSRTGKTQGLNIKQDTTNKNLGPAVSGGSGGLEEASKTSGGGSGNINQGPNIEEDSENVTDGITGPDSIGSLGGTSNSKENSKNGNSGSGGSVEGSNTKENFKNGSKNGNSGSGSLEGTSNTKGDSENGNSGSGGSAEGPNHKGDSENGSKKPTNIKSTTEEPPYTPDPLAKCPTPDWILFHRHRYSWCMLPILDSQVTPQTALATCQQQGNSLAVPTGFENIPEIIRIVPILAKQSNYLPKNLIIGGEHVGDKYEWTDGVTRGNRGWNWAKGKPRGKRFVIISGYGGFDDVDGESKQDGVICGVKASRNF
ncbi:unnamed protein product [Caenorhabditis angaria]|uniref:C-type lectin domain-containing protein n=1 Tax=Caenorhabditis angaria TaxID=860376 RepID=A0A9P1N3W6_9PELO|nr:unnamed protein product [Caenorhabditis angaria]